ncbi:peptidoglycan editing factor PgeF [Sneathiella sp. P13V-1]|uniref:peptidoglycan editing factor PgeF n=1 Tax=Sneathiella sp. P13V-1 TaxID=2697366 RepID=UPI00187B687D|nr:peptidoglycan editing factor PgeF [Sneathiella sp. P13V-1]MBE7638077.1 peptidoglycan editing factor PgeF [Sneathiella sp. P13V-1]
MITADILDNPTIAHGFMTRQGGVSEGIYEGLNCGAGSDDDPQKVIENKSRAMGLLDLPASALRTLYQIHSAEVVTVDEQTDFSSPIQADAMVTKTPGLALGILTADCVPILFADTEAGVIGAAHSGWKGSLGNIARHVLAAMEKLGATKENIQVAIGPSIQQPSYEVGPDFPAPFLFQDRELGCFFIPSKNEGHWMFDLTGFVQHRIAREGVTQIERLGHDTYKDPRQFYSYRRMCHQGEADYGRQLSAIALRK